MVQEAQRRLRALGAAVLKVHGSALQPRFVDCFVVYQGKPYVLEGKLPGQKLTPHQANTLRLWARAGATVGVFHSPEEAEALVLGASR